MFVGLESFFTSRNMNTKVFTDWQIGKETVLDRNRFMFNKSLMSDITFVVRDGKDGEDRRHIPAHKYVLATSSPVFYAMFYGNLAEKSSEIHLPDTDSSSFLEFLKYLYSDECNLTVETAIDVLYLAKKYILPHLEKLCTSFLQESITAANAFTLLCQSVKIGEDDLEKKCWYYIEAHCHEALTSTAFLNINQEVLINMLEREGLNAKEDNLFQSLVKWSTYQCEQSGLEVTAENKRAVLGNAVYCVRYLTMPPKEFAEVVSKSDLLTKDEIIAIFQMLNSVSPSIDTFQTNLNKRIQGKPRQLKPTHRCSRFAIDQIRTSKTLGGWQYTSGHPDILSFSVDKDIYFHGVRLFGALGHSGSYHVDLTFSNAKISDRYYSERKNTLVPGFDVLLPSPVVVKKGLWYEISATIKGNGSYYGERGMSSVKCAGMSFNFRDCSDLDVPNNKTLSERGQFYEILFSVCCDP